jgi:hypothetical protein
MILNQSQLIIISTNCEFFFFFVYIITISVFTFPLIHYSISWSSPRQPQLTSNKPICRRKRWLGSWVPSLPFVLFDPFQ